VLTSVCELVKIKLSHEEIILIKNSRKDRVMSLRHDISYTVTMKYQVKHFTALTCK